MHATGHTDRSGGGGGGGSWRLPPDETLQVADPKSAKEDDLYQGDGHNWRSIIFSLMVISFVIAGIVTAIYLLGYVDELLYWSGRRMRLDEFLRGDLTGERLPTTWVSSHQLVYQADDGGLLALDTFNNTLSVLVTNHTLRQLNVRGYQCSPNLRYVLFQHNIKEVYRRTFTAHYTVYDVTNDHHIPLFGDGQSSWEWQYAAWLGADGALLLAADNEVLARPGPPARRAPPLRLTNDAAPGRIYNGVSDWLYQEEVTKTPSATWGSSDGTLVMYAQYDDSAVSELRFPRISEGIGGAGAARSGFLLPTNNNSLASVFPDHITIRYPTPGSSIPKVKLWIVVVENTTSPTRWEVRPPGTLDGMEYYLISAQWVGKDNSHVGVVWMNRAQNLTVYSSCYAPNWTCTETHSEKATDEPWLEVHQQPVYSEDGSAFLLLAAVQEGGGQYYTHIKHVDVLRQRIAVLSHGKVEVAEILAWDQDNHLVYYLGLDKEKLYIPNLHPDMVKEANQSSAERPGQRHVYVVRDPSYGGGSNSVRARAEREEPRCLTCELAVWPARLHYANCSYWRATFSPPKPRVGISHYVLECGGPGPPLAGLHDARTHKLERILYDTRPYRSVRLRELALPTRRSFDVQLSSGSKARVQLLLPPSWREELRDAAFPVLVHVDGRPGSQQVTEKFLVDWGSYMSSRNDVVYVKLDVAGARGLPRALLRGRLGGVEVADQLAVIRYLLDTFKFLDVTRVAVWGWGYGGYVTAMLLGSQQSTLKCGIAVSPITDWLYYNAAFTERILGQPSVNYKGYVEADASQRAHHVPPHALYLVHGMADMSAPYPHALQLARALTDAGVLFRYQAYADEGHDLKGVIEHVYRSMEDYLRECLSLDPEDTKLPPPDR
ncbi:inactive dipeptidyl peptidase 10 isoform X1 [Galleria mellonella]|uniref:Inactive dipeptidyl peptidase 10 isoform X1 n=1 Tax=Galleria mellonella TaxID=7137 RepID=A0A6J3BTP4_GALME|nr:inactive dipeptidyl peptidase 10 isoform X1 [Galleria mellonella]XP_031763772.1 inactive dipeptidyl peptidase 10 isoform X1 [Galleria mellonella]